jgi:putative membrane-bound dehydrogenase-like protein
VAFCVSIVIECRRHKWHSDSSITTIHQLRLAMSFGCLRSFVVTLSLCTLLCASSDADSNGYVASGARVLTVADGYTIELIAAAPLVERPIAVAHDERGRLYVTDSGGMSERAAQQLETKPHRIRRLEDTDGDGVYDRSTLFADRMMFPEGCMWRDGSLYVAAPPEIWKLTDLDDDGICDRREVWFDGKTLTGCGNDLHGPYEGPDGRIYWCKGAFAEQRHLLPDGRDFVTRSSHIFRARPDGSGLEPVLTGGMDNPVNVAFLPNGDRFLSCTFLQFPEAGRRDGLLHAVYGGVYGKRHASIFDHQQTGDVMPVLVHQGAAAPCGLIAGSRSLFGDTSPDSLYACYFNLHQVVQHRLTADGATWTSKDTVLVSSEHPDFHPTDVSEDADGSLLVVDTGGWYKVCCPTSLMAKPDVLGGIYRVRRKDATPAQVPLGADINWKSLNDTEDSTALAMLLDDPRLFVRKRATNMLRNLGEKSVPALTQLLKTHPVSDVRCDAVWTLSGIDVKTARAAVRDSLTDTDPVVRSAAVNTVSLWRDAGAVDQLHAMLTEPNLSMQRAAAEAIGRIGNVRSVTPLLKALPALDDWSPDPMGAPVAASKRMLHHSLVFALIEINEANPVRDGLDDASANVRQATLVALDQMLSNTISVSDVIPALNDADERVRITAGWVASRHPEWAEQLVDYLRRRIVADEPENERTRLTELLAKLSFSAVTQSFLAKQMLEQTSPVARTTALRAVAQSGLPKLPAAWHDALAAMLPGATPELTTQIVSTVSKLPQLPEKESSLKDALLLVAMTEQFPESLRIEAANCASPLPTVSSGLFRLLMTSLVADDSPARMAHAATLLGSSTLSKAQRDQLLTALPDVGPLELPRLLPALQADHSAEYGSRLLLALKECPSTSILRQDQAKALFEKFPDSIREASHELMSQHYVTAAQQAKEVASTMKRIPAGDAQRGQEIFVGQKAGCLKCHKLGYHGGSLGPDLTKIGRTRKAAELLEAILYPNATIVRGYEPVTIELVDGRILAGIVTNESSDLITLGIDAEKTAVMKRSDIEQIVPSKVSPMPQGILKLLNDQDIADVLAFLTRSQQ